MLESITSNPAITGVHKDVSLKRLERTCAEFESIFITYMLKSTRATIDEDSLFGNSNESKIIESMFDEYLAQGVARGGGLGLGKMIFEHLKD